jgi:glyoxylase-like metal-dependent hydrolase (beta-lactamase superfamily II)
MIAGETQGDGMSKPLIDAFFHEPTNTVSYLVADPASGAAAVIDPVLDFDPCSGAVATASAEAVLAKAAERGWTVRLALETHAHADHLSAAPFFKERTGAKIGIGTCIREVQAVFGPLFDAEDVEPDGGDFDLLFEDGERVSLGEMTIEVMAVPGHTCADVAYRIDDAVFVGDSLFMPDYGTARTDFPGGCAHQLFQSIQRILNLPDETRLFMCHDYKAPGRDAFAWETTVAAERANVHLAGKSEEEFVAMREARDATLATPKLLLPAIQVNMRAGRFPPAGANGMSYLKIPVKVPA